MAQLTYTFTQLSDAANHAIGRTTYTTGDSAALIVNAAVSHFARLHSWAWRTRFTTLSTVNAQTYIDLPADFGEMVGLWGNASPYSGRRLRAVREWEMPIIRQQSVAIAADARLATTVFWCLSGKAQASATALGTYAVQIYPTPTSVSNALTLVYRCLPPVLSGGTDVADMPADAQECLLQWVKAFAQLREAPAGSELPETWARAEALTEAAKAADLRVTAPQLLREEAVIEDYFQIGAVAGTWA